MTNRIVGALEHAATKLGKTLGEDAGKAVKDLYHSTGHHLTGIAEDTTAADLKHETALRNLLRDSKQTSVHAPHDVSDPAHLPHEGGRDTLPSDTGGPTRRARDQVKGQHPDASTRPPASVNSGGSDPVDMASGRMFLPQSDIVLPGVLPLVFTRRVESGYRVGRWFGPSWSSTADQRLEADEQGVVLVTEDGMLLSYRHPEPGGDTVLPESGPRWPLARTPEGDWTVHDPGTGRTRHFTSSTHDPGVALLDQITDRNGNWITFAYDDATGAPTAIRHHAGYHLTLTTHDGRITALHAQGRQIRRYHYTDGNLISVTNAVGATLRLTYDDRSRVTSWTDSNGHRYDYHYDDQDRCIAEGGQAGHIDLSFTYDGVDPDSGNRVTTATDAAGHTTRYLVDHRLRIVAETDPLGNTTRTQYGGHDQPTSVTDPLGHTTSYAYDDHGRLTAVTRPDGTRTTAEYNHLSLPVTLTDPDGSVWRQEFNDRRNRTALIDPAGAVTRYGYDDHGRPVSVTNTLGQTTVISCDAAGLPIQIADPLGAVTTYTRDSFGRPTAVTDPLGVTEHLEWTAEGKLARRVAGDGATESWAYDGEGNCVRHTDPAGGVTSSEYTHFDLLAARTGPDGARYEFTHDAALHLTQVTGPHGLTWSYRYDPAGRLAAETDFDGRILTYTHDAAGRLISRTNPLGQTLAFRRDRLGRLARLQSADQTTTYSYDPAGRLVSAAGADARITYQRDLSGRVTTETVTPGAMSPGTETSGALGARVLTREYDGLGRVVRRTTPTGATTTYAYDPAGRRTALTTSGHTLTFTHDAAGQETTRRIGDTLSLDFTYDPTGRLTGQLLTAGHHSPVHGRTYTYRADGHLSAVDDHLTGTHAYDLDPAGRVTAVRAAGWSETYAYDETGNQIHAAWPDVHPDTEATGARAITGTRITAAGSIRYEHDAAGRMTWRRKTRLSKKPDTWHYTWDAQDRLTTVTTPDGTAWHYRYDPLGRRIAKQRLAPDCRTVTEQVDFTWDGTTLVEQTTTGTTPHPVTLTWDHDGLHPLAQTERITDTTTQDEIDHRFFAIITDLVGTPTHLVDETGDIAWHARTTLWGTTTWPTASTAYTPLRFPGQYHDPETGLHYNHHRYYDPATARYTTPDPLGLAPSPNPLTYVHNPNTWADPLGLSPYQEFHTVQSRADAERLRNGGEPWPPEDTRGQYGEGVYSWGSEQEAQRYAERLRSRGADVEITRFRISSDDFDGLRRADIVGMTPSDAEAFVDRHSRLYGAGEPHDYDYIRGHTGMGNEHFFHRRVFHLLEFLN